MKTTKYYRRGRFLHEDKSGMVPKIGATVFIGYIEMKVMAIETISDVRLHIGTDDVSGFIPGYTMVELR